jgi:heme-degrading monooxygenase HmoA
MTDSIPSTESPILIDLWTVDPARADELIRAISSAVQGIVAEQPGFVGAQVYRSVDGHAVLLSVSMRTVQERQQLTDSAEGRKVLRELRAIGSNHVRLFRLVESFGSSADPPASVDEGSA